MNDEDLFERYFRNALTVGELDELKRRLRESPETRKAFARFTEERSILVRLTGRLAGMESRELPPLPEPAPGRALPALRSRRPVNPYFLVAGAAAAAVVLLSILLTLPSAPKPTSSPVSTKPNRPPVVSSEPTPPPEPPKPALEPPKPAPIPTPEEPKKPEEPTKPEPAPKPPEPAPKPEEPRKPEPPRRETVVETSIASLEKTEGTVLKVSGAAKTAAKTGEALLPGQGVETVGPRSAAVFTYPDGTRLRLEGDAAVLDLRADDAGKRLSMAAGVLTAEVAKQPEGRPMTLSTPHGRAAILGTSLKLIVIPSTSTRLEVRQGRVELTRASDGRSIVVQADQFSEVLDSPNGNGEAWIRYSRKVETGTATNITIGYKSGTRSPSGPTVGFDQLRIVPGAGDDFEIMPRWDSMFDGAWGGPATWTIEPGGHAGRFLQAARPGPGSSVKAKVYAVPSRATLDVSAFLKCPSGSTADYWAEFGYRLGSHAAQDFDVNAGAWTIIKKFDSSAGGDLEVKPLSGKK